MKKLEATLLGAAAVLAKAQGLEQMPKLSGGLFSVLAERYDAGLTLMGRAKRTSLSGEGETKTSVVIYDGLGVELEESDGDFIEYGENKEVPEETSHQ